MDDDVAASWRGLAPAPRVTFSATIAEPTSDGKIAIGLIDGRPPIVLECSAVAGLQMIAAMASALAVTRRDLFSAIDPGPTDKDLEEEEADGNE